MHVRWTRAHCYTFVACAQQEQFRIDSDLHLIWMHKFRIREFVGWIVLHLIRLDHQCHFARINSSLSYDCFWSICDNVADDATNNIPRNRDESRNQKQQNETEIIKKTCRRRRQRKQITSRMMKMWNEFDSIFLYCMLYSILCKFVLSFFFVSVVFLK